MSAEGGGELARLQREWVAVKEQLRRARRNMRQFLRRVEREWWRERIEECKNACNLGRMGEMYKEGQQALPGQSHCFLATLNAGNPGGG